MRYSTYDQINLGGKLYSINDVLDKTIIANKDTFIYRNANDTAKPIFTAKKGSNIGKVYSWVKPSEYSSFTWLQFYDNTNRPYYIRTDDAATNYLKDQGVKDTATVTKEEAAASVSTRDFIAKNLKTIFIIGAVAFLLKEPISNLFKK